MIAFNCPKCGKTYSVKDEFAGRKTTCRNPVKDGECGTALVVPATTTSTPTPPQAVPIPSVPRLPGITVGWNNLPWGADLAQFKRRFPGGSERGAWWITGEGQEELAGIRMDARYAFNKKGQFYGVTLVAQDGSATIAALLNKFGSPGDGKTAGWSHGTVNIDAKLDGRLVMVMNTAFQEEAKKETEEPLETLNAALLALAGKDHARAENLAQVVLQQPNASRLQHGLAFGIIGMAQRIANRCTEAQHHLEKAFALGSFTAKASIPGIILPGISALFADTLADCYGLAIQSMIPEKIDQAKSLCPKLADLIAHFQTAEGFDRVKHEGFLFISEGMIATKNAEWEKAVTSFKRLLVSPHKEYFSTDEDFKCFIGLACENIGRIYFLVSYRVEEAVKYLQEALRHFSQADEQYAGTLSLLKEAKSQPVLPPPLKTLLDSIRAGNAEARLNALYDVPSDLESGYLRAVQSAVHLAMREGDGRIQLVGAIALVRLGDESDIPVKALLGNLTPPSNESTVKCLALHGLSYVKGRADVIGRLMEAGTREKDAELRERAIFALATNGNATAKEFVKNLATKNDGTASFALEWARKEPELLRTAILEGRKVIPGAAFSVFAAGFNGVAWGTSLAEFRRRFRSAEFNGFHWSFGEEDFAGIPMTTCYYFNKKDQFNEIALSDPAGEGTGLLRLLMDAYGRPNGKNEKGLPYWSYGPVVLLYCGPCLLENTDFADDPGAAYKHMIGSKREAEIIPYVVAIPDAWHLARNNKTYGPYTANQLMEFATTGKLSPDDMLVQEGQKNWQVAKSLDWLRASFPQTHKKGKKG